MSIENGSQNTSVSAGLSAMIQAAQTGGDLRSAFNSPESVSAPAVETNETEEKEQTENSEEASETINVSELQSNGSKDSKPNSEKPANEKAASDKVEDIEEITFTDNKGRRTVKVDFSDRDKLKKLASLAYGARKFQVERDQERQERAKEREESQKLKADMTKFESVYEKQGIKGLVMMLEGQEGLDKFLTAERTERERWEEMTPSERNSEIRAKEEGQRAAAAEASKADYEKRLEELDKRQRDADEKVFESKLHPAFDRYRFNGKLGDAVAEHRLDQAIWDQTMDALQPYEDKGLEITQAMIDKEFRKASQELSKIINVQAQKQTKVAVQKAKNVAQTKAQAKVSQGMHTSSKSEQFKSDIASGNIKDALRAFMSGDVKLTR